MLRAHLFMNNYHYKMNLAPDGSLIGSGYRVQARESDTGEIVNFVVYENHSGGLYHWIDVCPQDETKLPFPIGFIEYHESDELGYRVKNNDGRELAYSVDDPLHATAILYRDYLDNQ